MWLALSDSFLSVVDKSDVDGCLLVRARVAGHIEAVFPGVEVRESTHTDYRYRADVPRAEVAAAVAARIEAIDYSNFKGSVRDEELHDAYISVWHAMERLQPGGAYGLRDRRDGRLGR